HRGLSFEQRSLLYLYARSPASPAYNTTCVARIPGGLDVPCLRSAFDDIVRRHAVLRTTYVLDGDDQYGIVHDDARAVVREVDGTSWSKEALDQWVSEESRRPFDLVRGPILQVSIIRRSDNEHVLLCAAHHIAIDYWSFVLLIDEMRQLY